MPHHPRIECGNLVNFTTSRTARCEIWFNCNRYLEKAVLGHLAQCTDRYGVTLYAFSLEGTHKHELAQFPGCNRADFFRDFNCAVSRAVGRFQSNFKGGALWGRRYSNEFVPLSENIEDKFFYTVLQPVQDGLVESIDQYPGYNCFHDAVNGKARNYPIVDWTRYNSDKRWKEDITVEEYTVMYELKYARIPGYEELSQAEYAKMMTKKLKERTAQLVRERKAEGKGFLGADQLLRIKAGTPAMNPKLSTRWSFRPRIHCSCAKTREAYLEWYFAMIEEFWEASDIYRNEPEEEALFPPGMYKPPNFTLMYEISHSDIM